MTRPIPIAGQLIASASTIEPRRHLLARFNLRRALALTTDPAIRSRIGDLADCWASHIWQAEPSAGHDFYHLAQRGWGKATCSACRKPLEELQ